MEKIKFVSPTDIHVMFCLANFNEVQNLTLYSRFECYCKQIWTKHSTCLHGVSIVTCYFRIWRYHFFTREITWYFIGVYMIKAISCFSFLIYSVKWWKALRVHLFIDIFFKGTVSRLCTHASVICFFFTVKLSYWLDKISFWTALPTEIVVYILK